MDNSRPLKGPIVTEVTLVDQIERESIGHFRSQSLPGHLIHVCTSGMVEQNSGGTKQRFGPGQAIWYFENEQIEGKILSAPWNFYTINFHAPSIAPPPLTQRICSVQEQTIDQVRQLLAAWKKKDASPIRRQLRVHSILCAMLEELLPIENEGQRIDAPTQVWWDVEAKLRYQLDQQIDLRSLQELSGVSQRTVSRACYLATGQSPMKRVKQIRLSYARGLVQLSEFSMTDISMRVGYTRVQEFSRDYRCAFGRTPTLDRKSGPDYRSPISASQ